MQTQLHSRVPSARPTHRSAVNTAFRRVSLPARCPHRRTQLACQVASGSVQDAKATLLELAEGTQRGANATAARRGEIEEAQVAIEASQATQELNYDILGGYWLLRYTTAADVKPILAADNSSWSNPLQPPLRIGNIYQRFTSPESGFGKIDNIIQFGAPLLLEGNNGVTITVQASYEVRSGHTIALTFDAANVGNLKIDPFLESLIAPAILPRTPIQQMILLALKQFQLKFPFRSAAQVAAGVSSGNSRQASGGSYQLTYLDEDMLIGRAVALGGNFVFTRAFPPPGDLEVIDN